MEVMADTVAGMPEPVVKLLNKAYLGKNVNLHLYTGLLLIVGVLLGTLVTSART